ncbi:DUF72 domain-containing protein [Herbidospora cretacea]|uniref:DUF72 domain-containing protein n=1 Tax=Herbidospora cretacea TaxID=28444 RepID=UPI0004C4138C|nr:DUF72 domain-containing protein [Herbidospora cretacea]
MLVGTSGWQYADWRGVLYPPGLPQKRWLEHYGEEFGTVENNGAFYRLPRRETFEEWHDRTPDDFVMAVKASRYLTHVRRLNDPKEPVGRLMGVAEGLGEKLGPILIQLPPNLRYEEGVLDRCLRCFPKGVALAVEPRHESWWNADTRRILEKRSAALVWSDRRGRLQSPLWQTTTWGYMRFHEGTSRKHPPEYGDRAMKTWLERLPEEGYVYFNNDPTGAAVRNARRFQALATK